MNQSQNKKEVQLVEAKGESDDEIEEKLSKKDKLAKKLHDKKLLIRAAQSEPLNFSELTKDNEEEGDSLFTVRRNVKLSASESEHDSDDNVSHYCIPNLINRQKLFNFQKKKKEEIQHHQQS